MGCIGLIVFACWLRRCLDNHNAWFMISAAGVLWLVTAYSLWVLREHRPRQRRALKQEQ
jgi:hypothetical protein